jgi:alpha-beta hydrolase superfamily lysophospholipase
MTTAQVLDRLAGPRPYVLAGSDTGALFAVSLVASGQVADADALVVAGLPTAAVDTTGDAPTWDDELDTRSACPAHRARLTGSGLRHGALYQPIPDGWTSRADLARVAQPILGIHGGADPVSPLAAARTRYATAPRAELVSITDGRHDVLNDITHRTVAATIVLFLERLSLGADLPVIAVTEASTWQPTQAGRLA